MYLGAPRGKDERGYRISREHRRGKSHEREVRHCGCTVHQRIVEEIRPHAADHQPPAFLAQAIAAGQRIHIFGMPFNLDHGGRSTRHDLIRAFIDGFAHRSGRGARRFAGRRIARGVCGAGDLGGIVQSAHIIPAYAVKNLFQEVTLSCDYTGEA